MHRRVFAFFLAAVLLPVELRAAPAPGRDGVVASVQPLATEAGIRTFAEGGNAVDAAVAVALTLGVVDSHDSGIGSGCFMLIHRANGENIALDGRETAPAAATRDMFLVNGKADPQRSLTGPLAIGIPGSLLVYDTAVEHYGTRHLRDLLRPAADLAERGFPIDAHFAQRLGVERENIARFPDTAAIFLHADGSPLQAGETLRQPDLARSYRSIADEGTGWFYHTAYPPMLERWMKANGGLVTAEDLARYKMVLREPLRTTYRGYEIISFPPPSSGGVHVAEILNILENFDLAHLPEVPRIHVMAEAMKLAFADRAFWLGDPDFTRVPRGLADKAYAKTLAAQISPDHSLGAVAHGTPPDADADVFGKHTTHFCTADAQGNWVACTATLNTSFGSKVVVPGTGILLNNQMDDFSVQPGAPNTFGLVGGDANAVAPGKRPLSSMSPTIVLKDGRPILSAGAAGGPTIITATVINLVGVLDLGLPIDAALAQARFHHQWVPDELVVEEKMPVGTVDRLKALGHPIRTERVIAAAQMAGVSADGTTLLAAADTTRVPGEALGYSKERAAPATGDAAQDAARGQIEQVLGEQAAAWNRGDIDAFMEGYAKIPALRFASGGDVTYGWQETLDRYKRRYPDRAAMGTLTFSGLDVTVCAPDAALVFGRWRLKTDAGEPNGLFTLFFRKTDAGWRIVADHTSAAAPTPKPAAGGQ